MKNKSAFERDMEERMNSEEFAKEYAIATEELQIECKNCNNSGIYCPRGKKCIRGCEFCGPCIQCQLREAHKELVNEKKKQYPDWEIDCLKWRNEILTGNKCHYCPEYDFLPVDETCAEFDCCTCIFKDKES